ncbi:MAG TPA: hypothetical protein VM030_06420 [Acidimicrobiales bacterium]|nr:hypothetical protein [Acidimicrobiales bacterium]
MRRLLLGPMLLLAAAPILLGAAPVRAACTLPNITLTPTSGPRGSAFEVRGDNWFRNCPDGPNATPEQETDVALTFEQGGKVWEIGTAHPSPQGKLYAKVYVPDGDTAAERPAGQVPTDGGAQVKARGSAAEAFADYTVTPGSSNDDNNATGVPPGGGPTTTRPRTTTTTAPGGTTTTVKKASTTTSTEATTTSTTEDPDATSTTVEVPKPEKTTSTTSTDNTVAIASGDDGPSDGLRIFAAVLAVAGIVGIVGYLLWQSRTYEDEYYDEEY